MDYLLSCFSIGVVVMNPATQPLLTLMRHGQVEFPTDVCFGWTDVALSTSGRDHVFELANSWTEPKPSNIWCSDLQRSRETAKILTDTFSISCHCAIVPLFHCATGESIGKPLPLPGGETAEQLLHRVVTCYQVLCAEGVKEEDRVLLTAH